MLPGMNGYDVCREMRAAEIWTPVLMLSAKDGEYDQVDAFDLGADDYLVKPFSFPLLVARLRALIRRGGVAQTDRCSRRATSCSTRPPARYDAAATRIALTPREFGLLHHLMRHKGMVVSKLELLQNVWDSQRRRHRRRRERRRGLRRLPAPQGRHPVRPQRDPDRPRRRLPGRRGRRLSR